MQTSIFCQSRANNLFLNPHLPGVNSGLKINSSPDLGENLNVLAILAMVLNSYKAMNIEECYNYSYNLTVRSTSMNQQITVSSNTTKRMPIYGALVIMLGMLAMLAPGIVGVSVAMMVGFLVIAGGILRMMWAFQASSLGRGVLVFAIGSLTLLCGIAMIANPLLTTGILTLLLAGYFIVDGFFELIAAFQLRSVSGWGWLLFSGIISILLGLMIWQQFPLSGLWAIGTLLGIKLFLIGLMMITCGSQVRP